MVTVEQVRQALGNVMDPELGRSLIELNMVRDVQVESDCVSFTLALTTMACPLKNKLVADAKSAIFALDSVRQVDVQLAEMSAEDKQRLGEDTPQVGQAEAFNNVSHVISVVSGKGGVGKSLVSGLLAVELQRAGHSVGILDADITGPSIAKMFFPNGTRLSAGPLGVLPAKTQTGIKAVSINMILESEDQAVVWRGPVISRVIQQFWGDVLWEKLDYIVVDLPPGTSDASLTVMQSLPSSGIVLVTSPQDLAGMVVRKSAQMAQQLQIPMLGLVENMSYFVCPDTGKQHAIFGASHADELAAALNIPLLGRLPIDPSIAQLCDAGRIEDSAVEAFRPIAKQIMERATTLQAARFPH